MARSKVEKLRTSISRVYAVLVLSLYVVAEGPAPHAGAALLQFLGFVLVAVAVVGRLWCNLYVSGYKTQQLITAGPYSLCRNPLYLFSLVGLIGVGLSSQLLTMLLLLLVPFALYYPPVIRAEERKLLARHGRPYADYLQSTPRFLPAWRALREPETYQVNPRVFRKELASAVWFVWLAAGMVLIEKLHALHLVPTLLRLY